MTLRGVLLAGKWRTEEELNHMPTEEKRNALIVEMSKHTNQDVSHFQGLNNDDLIGVGAVVVFLMRAGIRDLATLRTYSDGDQRNAMVVENNNHTDIPVPTLSGKSNRELVIIGLEWYAKSKTVAAILELDWYIDFAKVVNAVPDIIASQTYDNRNSSLPLETTFSFEKEIQNKSSFSHEHGFTVAVGVETTFKAGIPYIAANETTVKVDVSTTNTWTFGGENTTTQKYSQSTNMNVPPSEHVMVVAQVTSAQLSVPYKAKVRTGDGLIRYIEGTWNGVSTVNLVVKQTDVNQ